MKWTHCTIIWSIFTGRMSPMIKKNAGRGGWMHRKAVPRRGGRKSLIRKMLGNDGKNRERSHWATKRVGRGRSEWQICLWLPGDDAGQQSHPGRWVLVGKMGACEFSQWLDNVTSINSKSCLGSWNSKSLFSLGRDEGWVKATSSATLPKLLPLHRSAPLIKYFFSTTALSTSVLVIFPLKTWVKSLGVFLKELFSSQMF